MKQWLYCTWALLTCYGVMQVTSQGDAFAYQPSRQFYSYNNRQIPSPTPPNLPGGPVFPGEPAGSGPDVPVFPAPPGAPPGSGAGGPVFPALPGAPPGSGVPGGSGVGVPGGSGVGVPGGSGVPPSNWVPSMSAPPRPGPTVPDQMVPYPEAPNFYFNAGFNKGLNLRLPKELEPSYNSDYGGHTPLGELLASKADMMPAIFKSGMLITTIILLFKVIAFITKTKHHHPLLWSPLPAAAAPVPVIAIEASAHDHDALKNDSGRKKRHTATAAVDPATDFDGMLTQLQSVIANFDS